VSNGISIYLHIFFGWLFTKGNKMFIEMSVYDNKNAKQGRVQIEMQFGKQGAKRQWFLQEVLEGNGWSRVSFSNPSQGTFEIKDNGVIWLWDQEPGKSTPRNTVIILQAPQDDGDYKKTEGQARIYDPKDSALKNATIRWKAPGLTPVRKRVLEIIHRTFPAHPGRLPIPNAIDRSTSYPKGVTNCGVLPGWIARQLGYYMPWEEKTKKVREELIKKAYGRKQGRN
jgi:hypothetical protein